MLRSNTKWIANFFLAALSIVIEIGFTPRLIAHDLSDERQDVFSMSDQQLSEFWDKNKNKMPEVSQHEADGAANSEGNFLKSDIMPSFRQIFSGKSYVTLSRTCLAEAKPCSSSSLGVGRENKFEARCLKGRALFSCHLVNKARDVKFSGRGCTDKQIEAYRRCVGKSKLYGNGRGSGWVHVGPDWCWGAMTLKIPGGAIECIKRKAGLGKNSSRGRSKKRGTAR